MSENALGQLASVTTNGVQTTFGYDGLGRRVRKMVNGVITRYLYDGDRLAMQLDANGQPQLEYSYYPGVDHPHAVRQSSTGNVFYYITNGTGSVIALVNKSNQVVNQYKYTPSGAAISVSEQVPQPLRFAARELDAESGLYYNRARYYDPGLGRFISEDLIGLAGGVNPYVYAGNNPVDNIDPSGLACITIMQHLPGTLICGEYCEGTAPIDVPITICFPDGPNGPTPPSGPSIGRRPPTLAPNREVKAFGCGVASAATALSALTDLAVLSGVGIGVKAAVQGGASATRVAATLLGRWASEEVSARYLWGATEHTTMRAMGKSSAKVAFGLGLGTSANLSAGVLPSAASYGLGFIPLLGTADAFDTAKSACQAP